MSCPLVLAAQQCDVDEFQEALKGDYAKKCEHAQELLSIAVKCERSSVPMIRLIGERFGAKIDPNFVYGDEEGTVLCQARGDIAKIDALAKAFPTLDPNSCNPFLDIESYDIMTFAKLFEGRVDPNNEQAEYDTRLSKACSEGDVDAILALALAFGGTKIDPNKQLGSTSIFVDMETALHRAIPRGARTIRALRIAFPTVNANIKDGNGITALMKLLRQSSPNWFDTIDTFFDCFPHANINLANNKGNTALMVAVKTGNVKLVRFLWEKFPNKIELEHRNAKDDAALDIALKHDATKVVEYLIMTCGADVARYNEDPELSQMGLYFKFLKLLRNLQQILERMYTHEENVLVRQRKCYDLQKLVQKLVKTRKDVNPEIRKKGDRRTKTNWKSARTSIFESIEALCKDTTYYIDMLEAAHELRRK